MMRKIFAAWHLSQKAVVLQKMSRDIIRPAQDPNLCGNHEEIRHKPNLSLDSVFASPSICPFLIMFIASYSLIVRRAMLTLKKPSPGLTRLLTGQRSCSTRLLRYLHCHSFFV